jgi:uncharacterized protein YndB with AHSA1/START domain
MTVRHDDSVPVRSVEVSLDVPGTPEQVWEAIATGPGFTAWFCPATIEGREGGAARFELAPGMETSGTVTAWEPPRRFVATDEGWMPGAPSLATEILVEARSGGTCRVRIVSSLFTSSAEWDDQLESFESGWPSFLRLLLLYLERFAGQPCTPVRAMGVTEGPEADAWNRLLAGLGLAGAAPGERRSTTSTGAPPLAGTVDCVAEREVMLHLEEPAPGYAIFNGCTHGGQVLLSVGLHLFGEGAAAARERDEPRWRAWIESQFPMPSPVEGVSAG